MTGKRYGAYHRVSQLNGRDPDGDSYITEKDAFEQIDGWAKMRKVDVAERYLDRDVSGSKMDRPALNRMLGDLRSGEIDGIVVAKVDRLSRADVGDALRVVAEINEIAPGRLAILDLGLDPGSDTGEMILGVLLVLARWQWKRYRTTWGTARRRAVERGVWIGEAPFGYWRNATGGLEPAPDTGPVVSEAYRVAAAEGLHAAMRYLDQAAPGKRWRTDEARRLLTSRVYVGESFSGELVNADAHEALTTIERFAAVQALPEMTARPKRSSGDYPLSHIARCGRCGAGLVGALQTVHGRKYRRMRCASPGCRGGCSINADNLEAYVKDRLGVALGARAAHVRVGEGGLGDARQKLELASSDLVRWLRDERTRDLIGDELFHAGIEDRKAVVEKAEREFADAAGQAARTEVIPALSDLEDPEQFRRALAAMVKAVKVKVGRAAVQERVKIEWADEGRNDESPFQTAATEKMIATGMAALAEGQRRRHPGAVVE